MTTLRREAAQAGKDGREDDRLLQLLAASKKSRRSTASRQ